jgi:peptidoglycan/xylan/chitin deacetylase (PgdA/CDA1 family)
MDARLHALLTFDFDTMSLWRRSPDATARSRGELGAIAVPRLLDLLATRDLRATFFVPGFTAVTYPDLVRRIRDEGHELGHHGWLHDSLVDADEAAERRDLERGLEALDDTAGVRPTGYRSPAWAATDRTLSLLVEHGFTWDSSLMGDDHSPYRVRIGDRPGDGVTEPPWVFGEPTELIEVPVAWSADDFPHFEYVPGRLDAVKPPSAVREIWQGDFEWVRRHLHGGFWMITMHPQVIGRGHRLLMLEDLIDHVRSRQDVAFTTVSEYVADWRSRPSDE